MKHTLLFLAITFFHFNESSFALPRFAVMTGTKCASCHVNPTGGQMRTEYGTSYSLDNLSLEVSHDPDFSFDPKLSESITLGADYRSQFIYAQTPNDALNGFHSMSLTLYGSATLSKKVTLYFKQDVINFGANEAYGIFKILPSGGYVKGGSFTPNYGWRLDDHTSYIRGGDLGSIPGLSYLPGMMFVPNYKDIGIEVGYTFDKFFATLGIFNGNGFNSKIDISKNKAFVGKVEYSNSFSEINFRVGISGYRYREFQMAGVGIGFGTEKIALLGEIDWTQGQFDAYTSSIINKDNKTFASFVEFDYNITRGICLIGKYDLFDALQGIKDTELNRVTLGCEFFPYSFVEVRPQVRINSEKPTIENNQFLVQTHLWF
ncbi:MAG: hypothetical protein KGZ58_11245 [Ignavibacteriales bacterium]|nr:hypothetical protein [Ignavibacteriales bacterium]